jgi:spore coat protein CotF
MDNNNIEELLIKKFNEKIARKKEMKKIYNQKYYYTDVEKSREYHRKKYISKDNLIQKLQKELDRVKKDIIDNVK